MNKQLQSCPWCHAQVKVEPGRRRLYRCSSCNQEFMYSPEEGDTRPEPSAGPAQEEGPAPLDFVETPFIRDLVDVRGGHAHAEDHVFLQACHDVLLSEVRRSGLDAHREQRLQEELQRLTVELCSAPCRKRGTVCKKHSFPESPTMHSLRCCKTRRSNSCS